MWNFSVMWIKNISQKHGWKIKPFPYGNLQYILKKIVFKYGLNFLRKGISAACCTYLVYIHILVFQ